MLTSRKIITSSADTELLRCYQGNVSDEANQGILLAAPGETNDNNLFTNSVGITQNHTLSAWIRELSTTSAWSSYDGIVGLGPSIANQLSYSGLAVTQGSDSSHMKVYMTYATMDSDGEDAGGAKIYTLQDASPANYDLDLGVWYHIVVTMTGYDGSTNATLTPYLNGVVGTPNTSLGAYHSGTYLAAQAARDRTINTIGTTMNSAFSFNGNISNVSYFESALNATQVGELYERGRQSPIGISSSLKAWWPLGDDGGSERANAIKDKVGSAHGYIKTTRGGIVTMPDPY